MLCYVPFVRVFPSPSALPSNLQALVPLKLTMSDQSFSLVNGGIASAITVATLVVVRVLYPMFNAANHKRVRTVCCGSSCVSSFDVEETTPQARAATTDVENPRVVVENSVGLHVAKEPESVRKLSLRDVASKLDSKGG